MKKLLQSLAYSFSFLTLAGVVFFGGLVNKLLVKTHLVNSEVGDRLNDVFGTPVAKADAPGGGGPVGPSPDTGPCPQGTPGPQC